MFRIEPVKMYDVVDGRIQTKVTKINIKCGYNCSYTSCPKRNKCIHKHHYLLSGIRYKFVILMYKVECKIHKEIDIHVPINVSRLYTDLSGTLNCHHRVKRHYNCHSCKYYEFDEHYVGRCVNTTVNELRTEGKCHELEEPGCLDKCKLFELKPGYDRYNKRTGELI